MLKRGSRQGKPFKFQIYIASPTRRTDSALARLRKICDELMPGKYEIEIVDIAKNPQLARDRQIVATPTVFRTLPEPVRKSIGDLSERDRALLGLDFRP